MKRFLVAALALAAGAVHAQHGRDADGKTGQYLSGEGMGYAKAAELNHFPGPMHVLELADMKLMDDHKREARAIGAKLVDAERALEELFRKGDVDPRALAQAVRGAASLEGKYRLSHLETHRRMRALLTEDQVKRYDALRH